MSHALVVDDDPNTLSGMVELVAREGFTTAGARSLAEARECLADRQPDLLLLDLMLPDGSGMDLFPDLEGATEVVLITGHASLETSIEALRLRAADYLVKPVNIQRLMAILSRVARPADLKREIASLRGELQSLGHFGALLGASAAMQAVYDQIGRVAPTVATVLIIGESGTGKELVARTLHDLSRRHKSPFLAVNCGAISPQLIESEMFGHEKGSFTGALREHRGFFERAAGGTLFLDEITEMPAELQVKLLRVLESGNFMRVGSDRELQADVRVVAATNRIPEEAVAAGKLREDLLYRLQVFPLHLPPLREREDDVLLLAERFLEELNRKEGTDRQFMPDALARLKAWHWPGNVRELRNVGSGPTSWPTRSLTAPACPPNWANPASRPARCSPYTSAAPWPTWSAGSSWPRSSNVAVSRKGPPACSASASRPSTTACGNMRGARLHPFRARRSPGGTVRIERVSRRRSGMPPCLVSVMPASLGQLAQLAYHGRAVGSARPRQLE